MGFGSDQPLCQRLSAEALLQRLQCIRHPEAVYRALPLAASTLEQAAVEDERQWAGGRVSPTQRGRELAWYFSKQALFKSFFILIRPPRHVHPYHGLRHLRAPLHPHRRTERQIRTATPWNHLLERLSHHSPRAHRSLARSLLP